MTVIAVAMSMGMTAAVVITGMVRVTATATAGTEGPLETPLLVPITYAMSKE